MARERDLVDEEDAEIQRAHGTGRGIPVNYKNADGSSAGAPRELIRAPSLEEQRLFTCTRVRTCGMCQHFKQSAFQAIASSFMAKLVHEYEWNPKFLGDSPDRMGRCGQDPALVTGPNSLGCSQFRAK